MRRPTVITTQVKKVNPYNNVRVYSYRKLLFRKVNWRRHFWQGSSRHSFTDEGESIITNYQPGCYKNP
jgi:hypothetical protein